MFGKVKSWLGIERKQVSIDQLLASWLSGGPTAAGAAVTPDSAMRCSAVYASVKVLSESVAQLPLILYRRDGDGGKERATDHPLYTLLHDQPNPWTTSFDFRLSMQMDVGLRGNAYAFVNRVNGVVRELVQLPAANVSVVVDDWTAEPVYRVSQPDGTQAEYGPADILHLRTLGSPHAGLSPIELAREAIGLSIAMEKHAARVFGNGARPSGVFKYPGQLGASAQKALKESWEAAFQGENAQRTAVLEQGMEYQPLQFSSVDLQFLELRRHQIAEIARIYRIPLHMLQDLERTTHNNAEHMGRQFLTFTLLPWLKLWEQSIRRVLLSEDERGDLLAEHLVDDLARAEMAARFAAYASAVTNGLLSPNEIRAAENRPPYQGGDRYRVPLNTEDAGQTNTRLRAAG